MFWKNVRIKTASINFFVCIISCFYLFSSMDQKKLSKIFDFSTRLFKQKYDDFSFEWINLHKHFKEERRMFCRIFRNFSLTMVKWSHEMKENILRPAFNLHSNWSARFLQKKSLHHHHLGWTWINRKCRRQHLSLTMQITLSQV